MYFEPQKQAKSRTLKMAELALLKCSQHALVPLLGERGRGRSLGSSDGLWYRHRVSTGWFPVMSQKRRMLPLFSGLTLFLAFAVHLADVASLSGCPGVNSKPPSAPAGPMHADPTSDPILVAVVIRTVGFIYVDCLSKKHTFKHA